MSCTLARSRAGYNTCEHGCRRGMTYDFVGSCLCGPLFFFLGVEFWVSDRGKAILIPQIFIRDLKKMV